MDMKIGDPSKLCDCCCCAVRPACMPAVAACIGCACCAAASRASIFSACSSSFLGKCLIVVSYFILGRFQFQRNPIKMGGGCEDH